MDSAESHGLPANLCLCVVTGAQVYSLKEGNLPPKTNENMKQRETGFRDSNARFGNCYKR